MKVILNMKKKIIIAITILGLLSALLVSCTKNTSTASNTTLANNSTVTSSLGTTSGTLKSGLPLNVTEPADSATINGDTVTVQGAKQLPEPP